MTLTAEEIYMNFSFIEERGSLIIVRGEQQTKRNPLTTYQDVLSQLELKEKTRKENIHTNWRSGRA